MPIEQIITITSNVSDCGGSGTDTIAVPVSVNIDGTVVAVNGVPCNAPVQPNPIISLDANNKIIITETGNCPDPNTILYGYTITDANNNVLFNKTGAASLADITNTVANLVSDLETIIDGSPCPKIQSYVEVNWQITGFLDSVSSGSDIIATNIDLTDPNNVTDLQYDIKTYIAANGGSGYDTVKVSIDEVRLTITIISSVAGFSLVDGGNTVVFDETAAGAIPCIGCYNATIYATPCDGSGFATIEGNTISVSIVPLVHDAGDVYYLDGTPLMVSSPFSGNQFGQAIDGNDVIALLNGDTNKPAGLQFVDTTSDANNTGSFVIAVGDACLNAAFIGVEPVQISYDCFNFQPTNGMFDRWRINSSGSDILFPSGAVVQGDVMTEMQATSSQPNIIAIDSSPFTSKYIAVSTNVGTVSTIEIYNTTTSAWEVFTPAYTNQGSPCV